MLTFQQWSENVCGVSWKVLKDKPAARLQYMIGFWWNSTNLTRSLDDDRRERYISRFDEAGSSHLLTLRDRQKLAGWAQRAVLTFPENNPHHLHQLSGRETVVARCF